LRSGSFLAFFSSELLPRLFSVSSSTSFLLAQPPTLNLLSSINLPRLLAFVITAMKRPRSLLDSASEKSDFISILAGNKGSFSLHKMTPTSKGNAPTIQKAAISRSSTILKVDRPVWPVNDDTTPEMSARKIRELEGGNDDQKLMAAFARHVIKPGRYIYSSRWVSKRSLQRAFPEHFDKNGFIAKST
jgi:hypothetical protein